MYGVTCSPCPAVYHPGFPLAYDSCEHSWWYISRSRQSHVVRQAVPPTNVSFFAFPSLSSTILFQVNNTWSIDQRLGIDVTGQFNGQLVRHYKTRDMFPLVDVSSQVKRSLSCGLIIPFRTCRPYSCLYCSDCRHM